MMRYRLLSPIRILLPISVVFFVLPIIFKDLFLNIITIPLFYFFGSYFIFLNFPFISESLHKKPIYVEDLILRQPEIHENDITFQRLYSIIMNIVLAGLFSLFSEYVIIQGIHDKPILELLGIIGGNFTLYFKVQNSAGKVLLYVCHVIKKREERRRDVNKGSNCGINRSDVEMSKIEMSNSIS